MNATGLSGNLMSLGAIDFGLLVDGAVIIVENAVRRLSETQKRAGRILSPEERTAVVQEATLEVRSASVFGEAIIAIVYLPILALTAMSPSIAHKTFLAVVGSPAGAISRGRRVAETTSEVLSLHLRK